MKDVVENKTGSPSIQCLRRERAEVLTLHYNAYCSRAYATHFASKFQNYTCALKVCPMFVSDENESEHKQLVGM